MKESRKTLERSRKTRIQLLREKTQEECVDGCGGRWKGMGDDILRRNGIDSHGFCRALHELLEKGRSKNRNILLTGPANCGKTFLLKPLTVIYRSFSNPATNTFAWVGVDKAEVMFLNDFRWSREMIPWHDLLLLLGLEGGWSIFQLRRPTMPTISAGCRYTQCLPQASVR